MLYTSQKTATGAKNNDPSMQLSKTKQERVSGISNQELAKKPVKQIINGNEITGMEIRSTNHKSGPSDLNLEPEMAWKPYIRIMNQ